MLKSIRQHGAITGCRLVIRTAMRAFWAVMPQKKQHRQQLTNSRLLEVVTDVV